MKNHGDSFKLFLYYLNCMKEVVSHSLPMGLWLILGDMVEFHLMPAAFLVSAEKFGEEKFIWVPNLRHFSP